MNVLDGCNGFVGRDVIFRPIQFEKYKRPSVVSYPRHAIVLNPHHTRDIQQNHTSSSSNNNNNNNNNNSESESEEDDNSNNNNDDDDDPINIGEEMMLCRTSQLQQILQLRWQHIGPSGCGLQNLGNTCFANSVLQSIAYTPALAQYFSSHFKAPCSHIIGATYDYAFALGETIRKIHSNSTSVYRPGLIISNLKQLSPHFKLGRQCDAHEFAVHLLNACNKSILFRQIGAKKVNLRVEHTSALHRIVGGYLRSIVSWSTQEEMQRLKKIGKIQEAADLQMSLRNNNNNNNNNNNMLVSKTYDPFVTLNVELVGHKLEHCLAKLCEEERLDGYSYISPRGVGVRATKQFQLHMLPYVLIIHLKRFNCLGAKVNKFVEYPKLLNVAPFCTSESPLKTFNKHNNNNNKKSEVNNSTGCLYELNAICVHEGKSLNYGHYYSVVRARNGSWLLCNDDHVSYCNEERALQQQAYMLFYSRVEQSSSNGVHSLNNNNNNKKENINSSQVLSKKSVLLTSNKGNVEEVNLGRPLTEEEIAKIIEEKKNIKQRTPHTLNGKDNSNGITLNGHNESCINNNNSSNNSSTVPDNIPNILNEKLLPKPTTDNSDDDDNNNNNNNNLLSHAIKTDLKNGNGVSQRAKRDSMYGNIVKAIRHTTPPTSSIITSYNNNNNNNNNNKETLIGKDAVAAVDNIIQKSLTTTVMRPQNAPKFRQHVRDPLWESEMDRGRVKRVRTKRDEYEEEEEEYQNNNEREGKEKKMKNKNCSNGGGNKFQNASITFDSRGRRRRGE